MKNSNRKGFTLIELLIVIAIIAVLSVVVILSLNPAELLRQARDSNRISDMATMKSAISLYLADVSSPYLGVAATCYLSIATTTTFTVTTGGVYGTSTNTCANWMTAATSTLLATTTRSIGVATTTTSAAGNGWIPVDFANISSGSPIGQEPIDPTNQAGASTCASTALSSCGLFYSYDISGTSFKTAAFMESTKYTKGGGGDVESTDGGNNNWVFEGGTSPTL